MLIVVSALFHAALLCFGERGAVGGGPRPVISAVGETQVTLQRPPAAVYHVALRLLPLSVACLGLVHFVSCRYCRRRSGASRAGAASHPETPAAPRAAAAPGVLEEPLISLPAYVASSCVLCGLQLCPVSRRGWESCRDAGSWCWQRGTRSEVHSLMEGHLHALLPSLLPALKPKRWCSPF